MLDDSYQLKDLRGKGCICRWYSGIKHRTLPPVVMGAFADGIAV